MMNGKKLFLVPLVALLVAVSVSVFPETASSKGAQVVDPNEIQVKASFVSVMSPDEVTVYDHEKRRTRRLYSNECSSETVVHLYYVVVNSNGEVANFVEQALGMRRTLRDESTIDGCNKWFWMASVEDEVMQAPTESWVAVKPGQGVRLHAVFYEKDRSNCDFMGGYPKKYPSEWCVGGRFMVATYSSPIYWYDALLYQNTGHTGYSERVMWGGWPWGDQDYAVSYQFSR